MFKIRNKKTYVKHIRPRPNSKPEPVVSDNVIVQNTEKITTLAQVLKKEYNIVKKETPKVEDVKEEIIAPIPEVVKEEVKEVEEKVEEVKEVVKEEKPKAKKGRKPKTKKENNDK